MLMIQRKTGECPAHPDLYTVLHMTVAYAGMKILLVRSASKTLSSLPKRKQKAALTL